MSSERRESFRSLITTLSLAFAALGVAILLVSGVLEIYFSFKTQQRFLNDKLLLTAQSAAYQVKSFIQEKFSILEADVQLGSLYPAGPQEQRNDLARLMGLEPAFRQLVLMDSRERDVVRISRLSQQMSGNLVEKVRTGLLEHLSTHHRYVGPVYVDEVTSEPMVVMAVPLTDIFKDVQGALLAEVNLKFMWNLVDRLQIGEKGLAYVVDRQGDLIAIGDVARVLRHENVLHIKYVNDFINRTASSSNSAYIDRGINHSVILGTHVPLETPDWALMVELPLGEAFHEVILGMVRSAAVMLVLAMAAGLIGVYVSRRLSDPILQLTQTATRIADGDLGVKAAIEGPSEVASLARAFNHMTHRLQEMLRQEAERSLELKQEIAERRKAEKALSKSEERYRHIFENAAVSLWEEDISDFIQELGRLRAKGVDDFRAYFEKNPDAVIAASKLIQVKDVNAETLRLYGAKGKSELLDSLESVFVPESLATFRDELIAIAEGKTYFEDEAVNQTLKGERIHVLLKAAFPTTGAEANNMLVSIMNISDRKRAEQELAQYRDRLEILVEERTRELALAQEELLKHERLAVLGQLTATVSHELRNPLGTINTSLHAIRQRTRDKQLGIEPALNRAQRNIKRCDSIIDELLDFTRTRTLRLAPVDVDDWLQDVLNDMEIPTHISLEKRLACGAVVDLDEESLRRCIVNLVSNACQAMEGHPHAATAENRLTLESRVLHNELQIRISDTGVGIDPSDQARIFEPLFSTKTFGVGLGLPIAKQMVEQHGGSIEFESEPGKETLVIIRLPLTR